jgi:hypothetical protein
MLGSLLVLFPKEMGTFWPSHFFLVASVVMRCWLFPSLFLRSMLLFFLPDQYNKLRIWYRLLHISHSFKTQHLVPQTCCYLNIPCLGKGHHHSPKCSRKKSRSHFGSFSTSSLSAVTRHYPSNLLDFIAITTLSVQATAILDPGGW